MSDKTNRIWDFLVLWPFIYFVLLMIIFPLMAIFAGEGLDELGALLAIGGFLLFLVHLATIVAMFVVLIYAVHRLYTQTKLPDEKKKLWLVLVMLFSVFAIPFLHFMHLRR